MTSPQDKKINCPICYPKPMGLSPEGWTVLQAQHDRGHSKPQEEKKCCDKCRDIAYSGTADQSKPFYYCYKANCSCHAKTQGNWETEYDALMQEWYDPDTETLDKNGIKRWIHHLLATEREKAYAEGVGSQSERKQQMYLAGQQAAYTSVRGIVEGIKIHGNANKKLRQGWEGYNEALADLISEMDKLDI